MSIIDQIAFDQIADERDKAQQENKLLKQRIKRLEEAGDKMDDLLRWQSRMDRKTSPSASAWRKAKEDKP